MNDRNFLIWLHHRLTEVHGEHPCMDYMYKLRSIIDACDPDKITPNVCGKSIEELEGENYE